MRTLPSPPARPAMLGRRAALAGALGAAVGAGVARLAAAADAPYELLDLTVNGDRHVGRRFTLLVPRGAAPPTRLLVALHGLGETGDERTGAHAWMDRYGLGTAYERLLSPPLVPLEKSGRHWHKERLAAVNRLLAARPFRALAVACPYTPNVYEAPSRESLLAAYAAWLVAELLPAVRRETGLPAGPAHTSLDGCSLGGYVGIEVLLRQPEHFGAWGAVQGAFGAHRVARYAEQLAATVARLGPRPVHLVTSSGDPFRAVNEQLAAQLTRRAVAHELLVSPGPHDQPFLRDSGAIEMLLWHQRL